MVRKTKAGKLPKMELEGTEYVFMIDPVAKPRMTRKDKWAKRNCVVNYWRYKGDLISLAKEIDFKLPDVFAVEFYIPFPKSYIGDQKERLLNRPHQMKPDVDNLLKGLFDAFNIRDQSIHFVLVRKIWAVRGSIRIIV